MNTISRWGSFRGLSSLQGQMYRFLAGTAVLSLAMSFVVTRAAAQAHAFKGEITDEQLNCVQTPMKAPDGIKDKTACVLYWAHSVQPNNKYVLYDAATKTSYKLEDQSLVQPYVGEKVEVQGTLDSATHAIKVADIKVDESAYKTGARS